MVVLVIKAMIMENRQKRSLFGPNFKVPKHRNVNFVKMTRFSTAHFGKIS